MEVPKYNLESEQALLGTMLMEEKVIPDILSKIDIDDFYDSDNQKIFDAIKYLAANNRSVSLLTVKDQLQHLDVKIKNPKFKGGSDIDPFIKSNVLEEIGGITKLTELTEQVDLLKNYIEHINIILRYSQLRKINQIIYYAQQNINNNLDPEEVVKHLESGIRKSIIGDSLSGDLVSIDEILFERAGELEKALEDNTSTKQIFTGFKSLDLKLGPLMGGNLCVIGARPAMGKSMIVLNIIKNNLHKDKNIAFFSLEMNRREIANRFISMQTEHIDSLKLKNWTNKPDYIEKERFIEGRKLQLESIEEGLGKLLGTGLMLDDSTNLTPKKIRAKLSRITMDKELDLIVIDYLQLVKSDTKGLNKTNEVAEITRELKILAGDYDCPVILLSQLSRSLESRAEKRPLMSDLRDSGSIEQDANQILFLYRERAYDEMSFDDTLEIIISKNRDGGKGTINFDVNLKRQLVSECSKEKLLQLKGN